MSRKQPLLLVAIFACLAGVFAQAKTYDEIELQPGVVLDRALGRGYLMTPDSGLEAVDLGRGGVLWRSALATKPLLATADRILAQTAPEADGSLGLEILDARSGRRVLGTKLSVSLPKGVRATVKNGLGRSFAITAFLDGKDAILLWEFTSAVVRGLPPGADEPLPLPGGRRPKPTPSGSHVTGALRVDLSTGGVSSLSRPYPKAATPKPLTPADRIASEDRAQFMSVDGRHVLAIKTTGDLLSADRITARVYERSSKARVAELHTSQVPLPYVCDDKRIYFVQQAYGRRSPSGDWKDTPMQLRAVDLRGTSLWSRSIADVHYRGPLPP